jgi:aryl-alcohol dehydrogenase-like predicted oxidoreductase
MNYRILGKSSLRVSEISLGCWSIGGPSWRNGNSVGWANNNDVESLAGLRKAYELGINHFDTADVYGDGHSERLVGKFLKEVPREKIIIATKVGWFKGCALHPMEPLQVQHQFEQSLANLGTDYVDIYYFHNADFGENDKYLHTAAEVAHRFKEKGMIRVVGQSAYSYQDFQRVCPVTQPDVLQFHYNALTPTYDQPETDVFAWAEKQNLGMVVFGPLAQGLLLDKYDPYHPPQFGDGDVRSSNKRFTTEGLLELRKKLAPIKERFGGTTVDLVRLFLQYALVRSANACVIPGFTKISQVESNAAASGKSLNKEEAEFIRKTLHG